MAKKPEDSKSLEDSLNDFLSDINEEDLEKSASLNILPKIEIDDVGIENAVVLKILTKPYTVEIPEAKSMSEDNHLKIIEVEYEKTRCQFIAQAKSFRYQYGVIMKKLGLKLTEFEKMIGAIIKVWLEWVELEKFGKQKLYKVALISPPR